MVMTYSHKVRLETLQNIFTFSLALCVGPDIVSQGRKMKRESGDFKNLSLIRTLKIASNWQLLHKLKTENLVSL